MSQIQENFVFWEPEVGHRGTYSIITTCISTLIICLWSALHLNIPRGDCSWTRTIDAKRGWVLTGLLAPQSLVAVAVHERRQAARLRDMVNVRFGLQQSWFQRIRRWSRSRMTSAPVADVDEEPMLSRYSSTLSPPSLGHENQEAPEPSDLPIKRRKRSARHRWTLIHGFYALMGGYACYDDNGELRILKSQFIEHLLIENPELVPDMPEGVILDKSKADNMAKALLFIQISWFCTSCVNRLVQRLPLALFEVSTLAHAFCSMLSYILWWDKPSNIQIPSIIPNTDLSEIHKWGKESQAYSVIPFEAADEGDKWAPEVAYIIVGIAYGVPHLAAWNATFVTHTEQLLWRIASCIAVGYPICIVIFNRTCEPLVEKRLPRPVLRYFHSIGPSAAKVIFSLPYQVASYFLFAESLRQLFYLPPATFQTTVWSSYFPHFS